MTYQEPIATPGSHMEPRERIMCDDCDEWLDDCECQEFYIEEMPDR